MVENGRASNDATPRERGFTLIELLIVVAVMAIVVAIGIPNLLNAIDRGRQKRTVSGLRAIASAVEAYALDFSSYPVVSDIASLQGVIDPVYIRTMPTRDGWDHPLVAVSTAEGYTIGSEGKDGAGGLAPCAGAPLCSELADAIIVSNGNFVQFPDGQQR